MKNGIKNEIIIHRRMMIKKALSFILAFLILIELLPLTSAAGETEGSTENLWSGKTAVFAGDSITAGSGTTKIYYQYLDEALDFGSVTAMGVGGSCISASSDYGHSNQPLIDRYNDIPAADIILVFMGTNDYGHETPLGDVTDAEDGTFYGALNVIVPALAAKHASSKIVFVTPLHRYGFGKSKILGTNYTYDNVPNGVGATLSDYADAVKTVCASNGVSVIDLYTECTLDPTDAAVRSAYMPDGLHPNASGHEIIAGILESHIREYSPIESVPGPEMIDIILFAGQSNMCGWAMNTDTGFDTFTETVTVDKAFTFNNGKGTELLQITEPISANGTSRYGMVPSFLNAYYEETGRRVCACFESHGGVNIDKFTKYTLDGVTGEYTNSKNAYYTRMVKSVSNARSSLEALGYEVGGVYLVWCQGENEAYYLGTAVGTYTTEYQSKLTESQQKIDYYIKHFNYLIDTLKEDIDLNKAFIIRIGHRRNDLNKNIPIIKAQNIIGQTNGDAVVVTTFLAGATAYKRDDGTVANLMRDAPHYLPEGYYLAGHDAGHNAGAYVNSGYTVKPTLYEYDVKAAEPYIYDPYAPACLHTYTSEVTEPTCTEQGYTTFTCTACGLSYTAYYVDARGHDYVSTVTEPSCTEAGFTTHVCSRCGDTYVDAHTDASGHTVVTDRKIMPTNANAGLTEGSHCSVCGEVFEAQQSIPAKGFEWMVEDGAFKVMFIGGSYSEDATNSGQGMTTSRLLDALQALLGDDVEITVGLCYAGGKSIAWHATQAERDTKIYPLRIITTGGTWHNVGTYTSAEALAWTDWDAVVLQPSQAEARTGVDSNRNGDSEDEKFYDYDASVPYMLDHISGHAPQAEIYYYELWATDKTTALNTSLSNYDKIASVTLEALAYIGTENAYVFSDAVPVGAAIQTARSTYLALLTYNQDEAISLQTDPQFGLQRDVSHLSFNIGRYIAAMTFAETLIPDELRVDGYSLPSTRITESIGALPRQYNELALEAVNRAVGRWHGAEQTLTVLPIEGYETDPTPGTAEALSGYTYTVCRAGSDEKLIQMISEAVSVKLPEDYAVTGVEIEYSPVPEADPQYKVTIRYGYTFAAFYASVVFRYHTYDSAVTLPTCTEQGYTAYICTECGYTFTDSYTGPLGHDFVSTVTEPTHTEQGYTTYVCSRCKDTYKDDYTDFRPLRILLIGNSFSWDAADAGYGVTNGQTYDIIQSMLKDGCSVEIGVLVKGSATLAYHATCAKNGMSEYKYSEVGPHTGGIWSPVGGGSESSAMLPVLESKDWDIIVIQAYQHEADGTEPRSSYLAGDPEFESPSDSIPYLLDYFAEHEPGAKVYYYMPWSTVKFYGSTGTGAGFETIAAYTQENVAGFTGAASGVAFTGIIPIGTAIQNARTTYLDGLRFNVEGDVQIGLLRDQHHLSYEVGRYIAGLTLAETLIPSDMRKDGYEIPDIKDSPVIGELPGEYTDIAKEAVYSALPAQYAVTSIGYETNPAVTAKALLENTPFTLYCGDTSSLAEQMENAVGEILTPAFSDVSVIFDGSAFTAEVTFAFGYTTVKAVLAENVTVTDHSFGEWAVTTEPTCTGEGVKQRVCAKCGFAEKEAVDALGHNYVSTVTEPTCTEAGYTTHVCSRCEDTYVDEHTDALGHDFGAWLQIYGPTCAAEGKDERECAVCGAKEYRDTRISGSSGKIQVSSPLSDDYFRGKKIVTLGDSVTYGSFLDNRTSEAYPYVLGELLGMTVYNKAVSGSCICTGGPVTVNETLTTDKVKDGDVITIMIGINDFNFAVKDGSWNGKPNYYDQSLSCYDLGDPDSTDTSTFRGAVRSWCEKIVELKQIEGFEDKQFIFITMPISSRNRSVTQDKDWDQDKLNIHGHTLREYCAAIMEICAKYDIPVFDANMYSGIYYNNEDDTNVEETGGDGVHLSAAGHALLAQALYEFLLENYSYETRETENIHNYTVTVTDPTCTERGYSLHVCSDCHYRYTDEYTEPQGHTHGDVLYDEHGHWYICETCGETVGEEAHKDGDSDGICDVCGHIIWIRGDLNGDGKLNNKDVALLFRYVTAAETGSYTEDLMIYDFNNDGEINNKDVSLLFRYVSASD